VVGDDPHARVTARLAVAGRELSARSISAARVDLETEGTSWRIAASVEAMPV